MNKIISGLVISGALFLPLLASAEIVPLKDLPPVSVSSVSATPLVCFDVKNTLKSGSKGYEVRGLQFGLIKEGFVINASEYGVFGADTLAAVNAFQTKYSSELLTSGSAPTGMVGKLTRKKLNSLYGCDIPVMGTTQTSSSVTIPSSVVINVKNVELNGSGVTVTSCNNSSGDLPQFPLRVRLNGIIRDFNVIGALKKGTCDTSSLPYASWGLTYDPGTTYSVVTALDPNGMYKTAKTDYPLTATTTLSVPSVAGAHLSIRGIFIKSNGVQGTLCNLGTSDLPSYPVRVTINGVAKDFDATGVRGRGQCQGVTWTYDQFGMTPAAGTIINATVNIDPNNVIQETNEFDNSATVVGSI